MLLAEGLDRLGGCPTGECPIEALEVGRVFCGRSGKCPVWRQEEVGK